MSMSPRDWQELASVYRAGADRARGWAFNSARQQDAEILDAQADRCEEIARERNGNPPAEHDHLHQHIRPDGTAYAHYGKHAHAAGDNSHDPDAQMTGDHGQLVPQHPHTEPARFPDSWEAR